MLSSRFTDALNYAAHLHAAQARKVSGEPYLAHLLGVAAIVLDYGGSEDEAIAALLHDAVEDQGGPVARAEIFRRFGQQVVEIVDGCTDAEVLPKPPWRRRKEAFLEKLCDAPPSVRLVVAADKLHNARALIREYRRQGDSLWQCFHGGREGTLWYHRAVAEILAPSLVTSAATTPPAKNIVEMTNMPGIPAEVHRTGNPTLLVEELRRTVEELQRLVAEESP